MTTADGWTPRWRVLDIVVGSVIAVAFGPVFLAWNVVTAPIFVAFAPLAALSYGIWLLPGVLVGLVVRLPGAALLGAIVSAAVSVVLGSPYGIDAVLSGTVQGIGAELGFAILLYRRWSPGTAILAGALSALGAAIHDALVYWYAVGLTGQAAYAACAMLSGALVAGVGGWLLLRALVRTGVLAEFEAGRGQSRI